MNDELDFLTEEEYDEPSAPEDEPEAVEQSTSVNWKQKLTSRKLWAAVVGVVVGLAAAFGLQENDWAQIAGIVTSAVSVVAYIFGEAKIDAALKISQSDKENQCAGRKARQTACEAET